MVIGLQVCMLDADDDIYTRQINAKLMTHLPIKIRNTYLGACTLFEIDIYIYFQLVIYSLYRSEYNDSHKLYFPHAVCV
jgi:hypothetical protein